MQYLLTEEDYNELKGASGGLIVSAEAIESAFNRAEAKAVESFK